MIGFAPIIDHPAIELSDSPQREGEGEIWRTRYET
jgi:hypothetical protein